MQAVPSRSAHADMDRAELASRLADPGLVIVDVLPRESFETAHIPGARSLPLSDVPSRAREVLPDSTAEIVLYCGGPT